MRALFTKLLMKSSLHKSLCDFGEKHPAFCLGIHLLLGVCLCLSFQPSYLLIWAVLSLFHNSWRRFLFYQLLALLFFLYAHSTVNTKLNSPSFGTGTFKIHSLSLSHSPFQRSYLYKGDIEINGLKVPCKVYSKMDALRPKADCDYRVEGKLTQKGDDHFIFKPTSWEKIGNTFSFAEMRFQMKESLRAWIKPYFTSSRVHALLSALFTGHLEDVILKHDFGRLGLQHILAISGFHFALIASFFACLFSLFLPQRIASIFLLVLTSLYFLFVGPAPSIMRAWIAISLFLLARIFYLKTTGINVLGVALIIEMALNPQVVKNVGFQLSFLATLAILLLFQPLLQFLRRLFPTPPVYRLSFLAQHRVLIAQLLIQLCALNFSVAVVTFLPLLFLFNKFPLLSLLYNLFVPTWIGLSLLFFLLGLTLLPLFPYLSKWIFALVNVCTDPLLALLSSPPTLLDRTLWVSSLPQDLVVIITVMLLFFGIIKTIRLAKF